MAKKKDKDKSLTNQYIRAIENPDSIGFSNGRWYQSPRGGDDPNSRGFGIDIKYNNDASEFAKDRDGKYLTEDEERNLRNRHIDYITSILDKNTPPLANYPSDIKQAMAKGLLYRGDGIKTILNNPSLQETYLYGTDDDFEKAVADYYTDKDLGERARLHTDFVDSHKPVEERKINLLQPSYVLPSISYGNTLPEVEVIAKYPHEQRVIDTMNASNAEFMQRLRNNDFRAIHNADGSYSTHVLGNADNMVFPAIQDVNGVLEDYRNLPWQRTLDKAIQNKDYIEFPTEGDARYFGEHYKKYYPQFFNHFEDNQYAEGGEMEKPKHWKEMSMADKADVMAAAIKNGVTTLEEIKKAWDDYVDHPDDIHEYAKGGYKPSASIKSRIANWEGSSMKTNRSFEAEAADFNRVIPASIRAKLNQQQLDALYSYGYNVGMGNLKKRVLPMLEQYAQGRAGAKDVANSMWASLDYNPKYRGLRNRRNIERGMFMGYAPSDMQGTMVEKAINMDLSHLPTMYFKGEVSNPLIEHPYYTAPKIELPQEEEKPVALEGLDKSLDEDTGLTNFLKLQQMMNVVGMNGGNTSNSFLGAWSNLLNGNVFADGGEKASIYKTNNGKYTTASGHLVEQIGWDDNGYARYRDTVTGDLGKAYEPQDMKKFLNHFLSLSVPVTIGISTTKKNKNMIEDDDLTLEELQYIYAHTLVLSKLSVIQACRIKFCNMKFPPIIVSESIKKMSEKELNNAILNVHISPLVRFILNLGVCY